MKKLKTLIYSILVAFIVSCSEDNDTPVTYPTNEDVVLENQSYGSHERNKIDVYLPAGRNTSKTKILVLIHGGGWIGGDKSDFSEIQNKDNLEVLKKEFPNVAVFSFNYRLATTPQKLISCCRARCKSCDGFYI